MPKSRFNSKAKPDSISEFFCKITICTESFPVATDSKNSKHPSLEDFLGKKTKTSVSFCWQPNCDVFCCYFIFITGSIGYVCLLFIYLLFCSLFCFFFAIIAFLINFLWGRSIFFLLLFILVSSFSSSFSL